MYSMLLLQCQRKPALVFRFISVIFLIYLNSFISKFSSIALQENMQALNNNSASLLVLVYRRNSGNMSKVLFLNFMKKKKISCAFPRLWVNTISRTLTLLTDSILQEEAIICVNLTISWYAIGLARLGVASISCGLLHSCGVLRLSIRSHILGWRGRKNMRICSAIWEKKQETRVRKGRQEKWGPCFTPKTITQTLLTEKFLVIELLRSKQPAKL